jgi:hypothetical protein
MAENQADATSAFTMLVLFACIAINVFLASRADAKFRNEHPLSKPSKWFYFFGYNWVVLSFAIMVLNCQAYLNGNADIVRVLIAIGIGIGLLWLSKRYLSRRFDAFVLLTIFSFNLAIWVAHYFYQRNRKTFFFTAE